MLFRKIATPNSVIRWEQSLPSLYATSFLAARASAAASCENCREGDHKSKECALSPVTTSLSKCGGFEQSAPYHTPRRSSAEGNGRAVGPGFADRPTCKKCNFSTSGCKGYPSCSYRHACLGCGLHSHKVGECRDTPTSAVVKESAQVDWLSAKREYKQALHRGCGKKWIVRRLLCLLVDLAFIFLCVHIDVRHVFLCCYCLDDRCIGHFFQCC